MLLFEGRLYFFAKMFTKIFIKILNSLKETLEIKKSNCKKIYGVKKVTRALFAFILKIVTNFYK